MNGVDSTRREDQDGREESNTLLRICEVQPTLVDEIVVEKSKRGGHLHRFAAGQVMLPFPLGWAQTGVNNGMCSLSTPQPWLLPSTNFPWQREVQRSLLLQLRLTNV